MTANYWLTTMFANGDAAFLLRWWLTLFIVGIVFFPLAAKIFSAFHDKGYAFAKIIGVLIMSYLIFVLGIIRVLPFQTAPLIFLFSVVTCFLVFLLKPKTYFGLFRTYWPIILFQEALFFIALLFWSVIRANNPEIIGLEKFMDFGFVNSALRTEYFPPKDMWFTPFTINYYYFGHVVTAILTKASGIPSFISYNLMIATLFALACLESFAIGVSLVRYDQKKPPVAKLFLAGILSLGLVTLAGNLHVIYTLFTPYQAEAPKPFWEMQYTPKTFTNSYWYPNATRFIYNTIHEFPIYSWVVADLHGHVLDIPVVLLMIAVLFSFLVSRHTKRTTLASLVFFAFLLSAMYTTNAWDGGIYLLLTGGVLLLTNLLKIRPLHTKTHPEQFFFSDLFGTKLKNFFKKDLLLHVFFETGIAVVIIACCFFVFILPFNTFFNASQIVSGVGVLCAPKILTDKGKIGPFLFEADHCQKSPFWQLGILYGFFYFFVSIFFIFIYKAKRIRSADMFVLCLILLATLLIIIPEFFYLKDIYPAHYRANTMFKLVFQAFIMLSLSVAYILIRTLSSIRYIQNQSVKLICMTIYPLLSGILLFTVFSYPILAIPSYYGKLDNYKGLNGIAYLKTKFPDDYEAILWLNNMVTSQPVILEAQGDSYTDYARISANTGLPTVLGWTVHEWLWRGSYDIPASRITDIQTMYETTDVITAKNLLQKYHVAYVVVGDLERQKYPNLSQGKFNTLGKVVYQRNTLTIYKLH